jgi:hypothetical protein
MEGCHGRGNGAVLAITALTLDNTRGRPWRYFQRTKTPRGEAPEARDPGSRSEGPDAATASALPGAVAWDWRPRLHRYSPKGNDRQSCDVQDAATLPAVV